jgi:tetratricopeptide (TPR) repeat protein
MNPEEIPADFIVGQAAFERGDYRQAVQCLESAVAQVEPRSALAGEIQLWLVTAYEASGNLEAAIDLCTQLTTHPKLETRQESKRILYILQAPALRQREDWITKIPDLKDIEENVNAKGAGTNKKARSLPVRKLPPPPPIDPSEINTTDNGFIVVTLVLGLVLMGWLILTMQN